MESIEAHGLHNAIIVRPIGDAFEIGAGHDRVEAARRAGLKEVPAEVRTMISTTETRFEYFVKDNTLRKDVDKRAVAKEVWFRYPDSTVQAIADRAGVSLDTAYNGRNVAIQERPELFAAEKLVGADGRARPRTYAPREPKPETNGGSGAASEPRNGDSATQPGPEAGNGVSGQPAPVARDLDQEVLYLRCHQLTSQTFCAK